MSQITEQKCPACGAPLRFDPASGKMVCDYCGTVTALEDEGKRPMQRPSGKGTGSHSASSGQNAGASSQAQSSDTSPQATSSAAKEAQSSSAKDAQSSAEKAAQDSLEGFDFAHMTDMVTDPNAMDLPIYNCVSCGAEVIAPAEQIALTCPYCGNNIVLTEKVSGKLRPDGVIPFKIQAKDLPDAANRFYKGKKLLPRHFFSSATMGKVTGVYVPFWVFTGDVTGTLTYDAQTSSSSRRGDYIITKTNHYMLERDAALSFDNLPVDASGRMEDRLMDSLEPFDSSETKPFDMRYLAGFTADRFDQKKSDIAARAEKRMKNTTYALVNARAGSGYGSVTHRGGRLNAKMDAKYILFPVYMFDISYGGKKYHFAVNGQTGKVIGDLPIGNDTSFFYFLRHFGLVSGALIAFSIAKYMLGM